MWVYRRLGGIKGVLSRGFFFFFMGREYKIVSWEQDFFFTPQKIISSKERNVSDRMSYIVLRDHWCNAVVLNVHAPSEEKSDDSKDSFNEILEQVFDDFPKYLILLGDFNVNWGERIFSN